MPRRRFNRCDSRRDAKDEKALRRLVLVSNVESGLALGLDETHPLRLDAVEEVVGVRTPPPTPLRSPNRRWFGGGPGMSVTGSDTGT